jgi:hypothetical protein
MILLHCQQALTIGDWHSVVPVPPATSLPVCCPNVAHLKVPMVLAELKYAVATLASPTSAILARPSAVSSTLLDLMSLRSANDASQCELARFTVQWCGAALQVQ